MGQQGEIGTEVTLAAVYNGSEENKKYFRYTPNGTITLGILNPGAAAIFEQVKSTTSISLPHFRKTQKPSSRQLKRGPGVACCEYGGRTSRVIHAVLALHVS